MDMNFPLFFFFTSFAFLMFATWLGVSLRKRTRVQKEEGWAEGGILISAILTLLFFIIGFSFSMAISRYDQRKNCELREAIAIGTAYSQADLLAPADAA